jgi:hypothetical protein
VAETQAWSTKVHFSVGNLLRRGMYASWITVYTCTHIQTCIHANAHTCVHTYIHTYTQVWEEVTDDEAAGDEASEAAPADKAPADQVPNSSYLVSTFIHVSVLILCVRIIDLDGSESHPRGLMSACRQC